MEQKKIEQKALRIGIIINILMGLTGLIVYRITMLEALFIDSYYTIIALLSGLLAIFISKNSSKKNSRFPNGFFILEPVYALAKSVLSLVLLISSTAAVSIRAYYYFTKGKGEILNVAPIIPYALIMICLCLGLSYYYRKQNRKIGGASTMLLSESKNAFVDGMISAGVGAAAFFVLLIDVESPLGFLKYTGDFFITVTLVLFVIKEPLSIIRGSSFEIAGGTVKDSEAARQIESCIQSHFKTAGLIQNCHIYKVGMSFQVYLRLGREAGILNMEELSAKKEIVLNDLKQSYEYISLDYIC